MARSLRWSMVLGGAVMGVFATMVTAGATAPRPPDARALARCQSGIAREGFLYSHWLSWRIERCLRPMGECAAIGNATEDRACMRVSDACSSLPQDLQTFEQRLRDRIVASCAGLPLDRVKADLGYGSQPGSCPATTMDQMGICLARGFRDAHGALFSRLEPLACMKVLAGGTTVPVSICTGGGATVPPPPPPPPPPTCDGPRACGGPDALACAAGYVCDRHDAVCTRNDMPGVCVPEPTECPAGGSPVCGCDGVTYASDCARLVAGVTKEQDGACPPPARICGSSSTCPEGTFCEFPSGNCGEGLVGVCAPMHNEACTVCSAYTDGMVCGCDGNTYANDCQRAAAGASAWFPGSCTP